jgi:hypothetical protein
MRARRFPAPSGAAPLLFALAALACEALPAPELPVVRDVPAADTGDAAAAGAFAGPQGVAVANGLAFVANANPSYSGQSLVYGPGSVTVVRLSDGAVLRVLPLAAPNPGAVAAAGNRVVVACSGSTAFDGKVVRPAGDGAVVVLDAATVVSTGVPLRVIPLPRSADHPLVGYPSSVALFDGGATAWLGSGTAPALFHVDLDAGTVLRGADDPVALGDLAAQDTVVVRAGPRGQLLAGRFEADEVLALDPATGAASSVLPGPFPVGSPGEPDGVLDLAVREGGTPDLYVLLGLASKVAALDTAQGPASVRNAFARTGTFPNRLVTDGDRLLVVDSGDNNVVALDALTGAARGRVVAFPTGTNPYDLALYDADGVPHAAVTGQQADALFLVDLSRGVVEREVR